MALPVPFSAPCISPRRDGFAENLRLLLDFVQKPVFTPEDTEKEKSIIASEIAMYDDDPDWVAYYQLLNGMYRTHPVKNPVAGAKETVEEVKSGPAGRLVQKPLFICHTEKITAFPCQYFQQGIHGNAALQLRQVKAMKKEDAEKMLQNRLTADTMVLSVVK